MSSFFNWLCFPSRNFRSKQKSRGSVKVKEDGGFDSFNQRRKLSSKHKGRVDHIRKHTFNENDIPRPEQGGQTLIETPRPNKRRKVQEIFNLPESDSSNMDENHLARNLSIYNEAQYRTGVNSRLHKDFGSEYTPRIYQQKQKNDDHYVESMYGYVPKIVRNSCASKALEGNRVDDYFSHFHRDNSLHRFAKMNQPKRKSNILVPKFVAQIPSNSLLSTTDKVSLIESEENDNFDMDYEIDYRNKYDMSSRVKSILEASFDSMWNNDGEVLY